MYWDVKIVRPLSDYRIYIEVEDGAGQDSQQLAEILRLAALVQRFHIVSEATANEYLAGRAPWIRARLINCLFAALARRQRQRRPA